jgi:hypothetical protein
MKYTKRKRGMIECSTQVRLAGVKKGDTLGTRYSTRVVILLTRSHHWTCSDYLSGSSCNLEFRMFLHVRTCNSNPGAAPCLAATAGGHRIAVSISKIAVSEEYLAKVCCIVAYLANRVLFRERKVGRKPGKMALYNSRHVCRSPVTFVLSVVSISLLRGELLGYVRR